MQGRVKPPVWGICSCSFLGASWVPCVRVCDYSHSDSVWLFIPWGLGLLCKCKGTFTALSLVLPSVWRLSIITDGRASSDQSPGPMLMWVHLSLIVLSLYVFITSCVCVMHDVCIVLGSSLVFLVFFYMLIEIKGLSCLFYHNTHQYKQMPSSWQDAYMGILHSLSGGSSAGIR